MTTELSNLAIGTDLDAKIFVSLELSKSRWGMVLHRPSRSKFSHQLFDGGDVAAVIEYLQAQRLSEEKRLGRPVRIVTCYEAGRDGFWLDRALLAGGINNRVFDAASLLVSRRAKKAKTDRLDGEGLLRTLMALERGDPGVVSLVRVPSVEDEDGRRLTRERERLVREETQHRNRITALLFTQGVRDVLLGRPRWTEKLSQLRTGDGRPLPPRLVAGPPKRFAQGMGAAITLAAALLHFGFGQDGASEIILGLVVVAATLESAAGFCIGCRVFALLMRAGLVPEETCAACANIALRSPQPV